MIHIFLVYLNKFRSYIYIYREREREREREKERFSLSRDYIALYIVTHTNGRTHTLTHTHLYLTGPVNRDDNKINTDEYAVVKAVAIFVAMVTVFTVYIGMLIRIYGQSAYRRRKS